MILTIYFKYIEIRRCKKNVLNIYLYNIIKLKNKLNFIYTSFFIYIFIYIYILFSLKIYYLIIMLCISYFSYNFFL